MEKHRVEEELIKLFAKFDSHEDVYGEIMELVVRKGRTKIFNKILQKNIEMIEQMGREVTKLKSFEKLQGVNDLYSMKFISKGMNIRILYTYKGDHYTILLCCFDEKNDSSVNSYDKYIPIALTRMRELEEGK